MTIPLKYKIALGAILLVVSFTGGAIWLQGYISHAVKDAQMQQELKDTAASNAKLEQVNKDLSAQIAAIKSASLATDASLEAQKTQPATADQINTLRLKVQELAAKAGQNVSVPVPQQNGNQVIMPAVEWRNFLADTGKCENGLGTCQAIQEKQSEQVSNLAAQRDGFKKNLDDLSKIKSPYIPPRNNVYFGLTSDRGGIAMATHRLKIFGDRFSVGFGAQANGLNNSRLFVVAGIPLGGK